MGQISNIANTTYADGPSSNPTEPAKSAIRALFGAIDASMSSLIDGLVIGGAVVYSTRAALYADLAHAAGKLGVVYNDGTAAYNGIYVKSGSSGAGSWAITNLALPSTFAADLAAVIASNAGKMDATIAALSDLTDTADTKADLVGNDGFLIRDSEDGLTIKRSSITILRTYLSAFFGGSMPVGTIPTDRLLGRDTAGTGDVELIAATNGLGFTGSGQIGLSDMPEATFKGRVAGAGTGTPTNVTVAQAKAAQDITGVTTAVVEGKLDSTIAALSDLTDAADVKEDLVGADGFLIRDSADGLTIKRSSIAILRGYLKTYFDGFYPSKTIATDRLLGRDTAGTGDVETIAVTNGLEFTGSSQIGLADMPEATFKMRVAGAGTGTPTNGTVPQAKTALDITGVTTAVVTGKLDSTIAALTALTSTADAKTAPVDGDGLLLRDSEESFEIKRLSWLNLKATLKTYFDSLYLPAIAAVLAVLNARVPILEFETSSVPVLTAGNRVLMSLETDGVEFPALSASTRRNAVSDVISIVPSAADFVPIAKQGQRAVLWLEAEGLGGPGLTREMRRSATSDIIVNAEASDDVPLVVVGGQVVLWLDDGGLNGPGLRASSSVPASTDGRTLHRMRSKIAQLRKGTTGAKLKVVMAGDSWAEMNVISGELRDRLDDAFGVTGEGFQSVATGNRLSATTLARSVEWTLIDGSTTKVFPYGAGPDGQNIWTASAVATLSITDLPATAIKIFYHKHGGTFRYRVDGGSWSTVTADSSGGFGVVSITGLSDTVHLLEMDTTGNAGIVSLGGFYTTRTLAGAELLKMGNGGLTGYWLDGFTEYVEDAVAEMAPDVAVVFLGTNDYRSTLSPPATYLAALADLAAAFRAAVPDIGLIFVAPPQTDGVEILPLSSYRDALYPWCAANNAEFLNLYDQFGTYAQGDALGLWNDTLHVSPIGAGIISDILDNQFLNI